jgi:hypothetical protein
MPSTDPQAPTVATWFIDPINGDDAHTGTADPHGTARPLRTHEELRRRIGGRIIEGEVEVILLDDFDPSNPVIIDFTLGAGASLTYRGDKPLTTLHAGAFTAVTHIDAANNRAQAVEDQSLGSDWGPAGLVNSADDLPEGALRRIRITGGPNAGAIGYACKDVGSRAARTSPFGKPAAVLQPGPPHLRLVQPQVGDPFVVESGFVRIDSFAIDIRVSPIGSVGRIRLLVRDLELNPSRGHQHQVRALAEPVPPGPGTILFAGCGLGRLSPHYGNKVTCELCRLGGTIQHVQSTLLQLSSCCCLGEIVVFEGGRVVAFLDTLFQGNGLRVKGLTRLERVGFFDAAGAGGLQIDQGGTAQVETMFKAPAVYGNGHAGPGAKVRAGGCIVYDGPASDAAAAGMTVTGTSDVDVAGEPASWASIAPDLAPAGKRAAVARND